LALKVGDMASVSKTITDNDIRQFAVLVGDYNPVHLDNKFAQKTKFGQRIAHGMLPASLISAAIGNNLPGPGTVYLSQNLEFVAPVYPGDTVTAKVTVKAIRYDKPIVTLATVCYNQNGKPVIKGEAIVKVEELEGTVMGGG